MDRDWEMRVRVAVFDHLHRLARQHSDGLIPHELISQRLEVEGRSIAFFHPQKGIQTPADLGAALTLKTGATNPYEDKVNFEYDGLIRYRYRDPSKATSAARRMAEADNAAVRRAMENRLPLVYLLGVDRGWYLPFAPVHVVHDDPGNRTFSVDLTQLAGLDLTTPELAHESVVRKYQLREVKVRVHQARFRQMVMAAYRSTCAMCALGDDRLLDAAHIVGDAHDGAPEVTNGMSLCKIHHAAFDRLVMGVHPTTLEIHVKQSVLDVVDGPMLRHGIQELNGRRIMLPRSRDQHPAEDALAERWHQFTAA